MNAFVRAQTVSYCHASVTFVCLEAELAFLFPSSPARPHAGRIPSIVAHPGLPVLVAAWGILLAASVFQDALGLDHEARVWFLDVDVERSFYTWFSQLLLAFTGLMLVDTGVKAAGQSRVTGVEFVLLGGIFFLLSADEALSFHEAASTRLSGVRGLHFAWVMPAAIICAAGLAAAVPFLRQLGPRVRLMMLVAAGVFLFGALGVEAIGGEVLLAAGEDVLARPYRLLVNLEEGAEGLGVILFLFALTRHRTDTGMAPGITLFR